ncbi:flagellar hook-associated protein FlgK [Massilia norwichensis]|uniref:Flagellar hook-associated protein 1 n=1 Tax=Massilia norwichensis TaxID=1442366 RepID=A0ABT2A6K1_9BURK|nr:flagellar hook-associated protein FlgK [Massilia norwichensis]MCS0589455.1 flagellar hook-associated protein FlgK [Massilia norwichensis]
MSLLSIGKSGLYAAQAALSTTGHNITNANVAGYSRQTVVQATAIANSVGNGYIGTGTQIAQIKRYSDEFLNAQVRTAQAASSGLDAYQAQITQIDNMLSSSTSGLSPALQDFFSAVQSLTGDRAGVPSRGALLSAAETLATRFQAMNGRMEEIREGVNGQVGSNVTLINSYASEIASLNDQIGKLAGNSSLNLPNDLLDKRDQLVVELNKQIKTTVVAGDNNSLTVSIGNGQPLIVGSRAFQLAAIGSPTDQTRVTVGFVTNDKITPIPESALVGGELGGLLEFRSRTLDPAQNALGRIAIGLAASFNEQHHLGLDAKGNPGGDFFAIEPAEYTANIANNQTSTTVISATISDVTALTASDYKVDFKDGKCLVTRLSDGQPNEIVPYPQTTPQTIDGIDFMITGTAATGDNFLVRPTANGAANFKVKLTDASQIAAAAPIVTSNPVDNRGSGKIGEATVDKTYLASPLTAPVKLVYDSATGTLGGFPAGQAVAVSGDPDSPYAAGLPVPFKAGATYTVGGMSFSMSGVPSNGDQFVIERTTGTGDTRNASLLGDLQTKNILDGNSATYQSAYAHLVGTVGNKTREVQVNADASAAQLAQAESAANNVSGVNLDEEAANLLKYQQAYQAAGKVMQIASTMFDTLLSIGH